MQWEEHARLVIEMRQVGVSLWLYCQDKQVFVLVFKTKESYRTCSTTVAIILSYESRTCHSTRA